MSQVTFKISWREERGHDIPIVRRVEDGKSKRLFSRENIKHYIDAGILTDPDVVAYYGRQVYDREKFKKMTGLNNKEGC